MSNLRYNTFLHVVSIIIAAVLGFYASLYLNGTQGKSRIDNLGQTSLPINSNDINCRHGLSSKDKFILSALKHVTTAHRYARSSKTITELNRAHGILQNLLASTIAKSIPVATDLSEGAHLQNVNFGHKIHQVCPEVWMGIKYGYPFYYEGYIVGNCSYGQPISELVSVLLDASKLTYLQLARYLNDLTFHHKDIAIRVITPHRNLSNWHTARATYHNFPAVNGKTWNKLLLTVNTPYIFIARDSNYFDSNARLHRLIRMVNYLNVDVAGGSHRNSTGHWKIGCFQHKMLNYEYRIVEGYDLSFNSCIHCDYISGPFIAKTEYLLKNPFDTSLSGEFVFLDFFYQLRKTNVVSVICPDAMFHTQSLSRLTEIFPRKDWIPFVTKWELNYVTLPTGHKYHFTCAETQQKCDKGTRLFGYVVDSLWYRKHFGRSNPPCCNQLLSHTLWYFFKMCQKYNITAETSAGTLLGGVKFYKILPWELDADVDYRTSDHETIKKLIPIFKKAGYNLYEHNVPKNCPALNDPKNVNCGSFIVRKSPWRLEAYGSVRLGGDILQLNKIPNRTKILIDGHWINAQPNPALFERNHFSDDIFKHVEHWRRLGYSTGWKPYTAGSWLNCSKPGHHSCLNQYLPSGNLQFDHIWL